MSKIAQLDWCFLAKSAFSVAGTLVCSLLICVSGTLVFSCFSTALVVFPLLSLDIILWIMCLRRLRHLARVRSCLSKLIAPVMVVCMLALDGMFVLFAGSIVLKVFAIGDEYFADNLSIPSGVPISEYIKDLMPVDTDLPPVTNHMPCIEYSVESKVCNVLLNPGEPGRVYARAYEVTTGKELSASWLRRNTEHKIRWSDNSAELYWDTMNVVIREGRTSKWYAARIEVWFAPESGDAERKLLEKVYRVHGMYH